MSLGKTTDLVFDQDELGEFDWSIDSDGDFTTDDFFDTSLLMSIYCERRALPSEQPVSSLRRGWIGNEFEDFEIGSKAWLYYQARLNTDTLNGVITEVTNGLDWLTSNDFIDGGFVESYEVTAQVVNGGLAVNVVIERANSEVDKRFYELWNNSGKT